MLSPNTYPEVLTHILSHMPPPALSAMTLVSHRFHDLVTTPHAWRIAFSRYFPGTDVIAMAGGGDLGPDGLDSVSEKRVFTRLTALASWRSEYILRTRLLRSLARGRPAKIEGVSQTLPSRAHSGSSASAHVTYNSNLFTTVNHLEATFKTGPVKKLPKFIHGADEIGSVSSSDPYNGRVDTWGFSDPHSFVQFAERFPGDPAFGLGAGELVGVPNSMDISQIHGFVHAEGCPDGSIYYRSTEEQRGRLLAKTLGLSKPERGIPMVLSSSETMCCTWIAKTTSIPDMTEGLLGILSGSSLGIVSAYSLGTNGIRGARLERGELIARWVLSPGVPIIAIAVDEQWSTHRLEQRRAWAVVLNALGEVFYLKSLPERVKLDRSSKMSERGLEEAAWDTGRSVHWHLIEPSRRKGKADPFEEVEVDGSYFPRGSWTGAGISNDQLFAETREIERFLLHKPKHFRNVCEGWDMQRRLFVDFAGGDDSGARENIMIIACGLIDDQPSHVRRFSRVKIRNAEPMEKDSPTLRSQEQVTVSNQSLFGYSSPTLVASTGSSLLDPLADLLTPTGPALAGAQQSDLIEEWRISAFATSGFKGLQVTAAALDQSKYSLLTLSEDPLLAMSTTSNASSPLSSPLGNMSRPTSRSDIPGQSARFLAIGTKLGQILVWNVRAPISATCKLVNVVQPVRVIHTTSPQISCLGLTALYLVHGGNDGVVQAWDLMASDMEPIRTLNSRFSSRARRRLVQAEASPAGVGINLFAAGAICLDPDPTVLRGMVSLGTQLRFWNFSASAADQYKGQKRHPRRSERGSNQGGDKFHNTGRGALKDYIANEAMDLKQDEKLQRKEQARLTGRFGLDLLGPGATEDEIMAYATLLSEEAAQSDDARRRSESESSGDTVIDPSSSPVQAIVTEEVLDADIAQAIRLSLEEQGSLPPPIIPSLDGPLDFHIRYAKKVKRSIPRSSPPLPGNSKASEAEDLDLALQLSLAEDISKLELDDDFPVLSKQSSSGSGKGKWRQS